MDQSITTEATGSATDIVLSCEPMTNNTYITIQCEAHGVLAEVIGECTIVRCAKCGLWYGKDGKVDGRSFRRKK